jgi:hypothetical protein
LPVLNKVKRHSEAMPRPGNLSSRMRLAGLAVIAAAFVILYVSPREVRAAPGQAASVLLPPLMRRSPGRPERCARWRT